MPPDGRNSQWPRPMRLATGTRPHCVRTSHMSVCRLEHTSRFSTCSGLPEPPIWRRRASANRPGSDQVKTVRFHHRRDLPTRCPSTTLPGSTRRPHIDAVTATTGLLRTIRRSGHDMGVDYTMHGTDARTAERHVASDCLATSERPDSRAPPRGTGMGKPTRRDGRDGRDSPGGRQHSTRQSRPSSWGEPPPLTSHV